MRVATDDVVTWSRTRSEAGCASGLLVGAIGGMLLGTFVAAVLPESWSWLGLVPVVVLAGYGAVRGVAGRRTEVTAVEIDRDRIRMVSSSGVREVDVAELAEVHVDHHRDRETVLRLVFTTGPAVWVPGHHDPELAAVLQQLLGVRVDEQYLP